MTQRSSVSDGASALTALPLTRKVVGMSYSSHAKPWA
jgi:hypothetical protein